MCVLFFAYRVDPRNPLLLLANRDEFYERPTAAASFWHDAPEINAGRDLVHGGTWLGVTKRGRVAAVTNYRDPAAPRGGASRGRLVVDYLRGDLSPCEYLDEVRAAKADYAGFNLLVGEINREVNALAYYSNREDHVRELGPGIYGLSNHLLDTPWPKVEKGKAELSRLLAEDEPRTARFFELLGDRATAEDADLPDTGIGYEREKLLSAVFIETAVYGTRSSTVVRIDDRFDVSLEEIVHV
jgi:uncharacterized protein with NRDE domain